MWSLLVSADVRSTLQVLEKGKVGVCETFSLLASEENVKSRKKLIAGFQLVRKQATLPDKLCV